MILFLATTLGIIQNDLKRVIDYSIRPYDFWLGINLRGCTQMWHLLIHMGARKGHYMCLGVTKYTVGVDILYSSFVNILNILFI